MSNRNPSALLALVAAALVQACAGSPPDGEYRPRPAAATPDPDTKEVDPAIAQVTRGYTQVKKDGQVMFCKRERQTGSNMSTMTCYTESQMRQRSEDAKKFGDDMKQQGRRCSNGPGCPAGG